MAKRRVDTPPYFASSTGLEHYPPRPIDTLSPGMQRDARRAFLILLATGLIIGAVTATGVVWVMHQLNLIGVPAQREQNNTP